MTNQNGPPRGSVAFLVEALRDFNALVGAGVELIRGQVPQAIPPAQRLEGISTTAANLLLEAGAVGSFDEGILVFHERIGRDKPSLRRLLRQSDIKQGRLRRDRVSPAQRATRLALKSGLVTRRKDGRIKAFTPAAMKAIKAAKRKAILADQKKLAKRQKTARAKLKGFA